MRAARPSRTSRGTAGCGRTGGLPTAWAASRVKPPAKTAQAAKEQLLLGLQQIVAPGDLVAQRALAGRQVLGAVGEQGQPFLQPRGQGSRPKELEAGGGQLDRQRQPVQADADLGHGHGVGGRERKTGLDGGRTAAEEVHGSIAAQACGSSGVRGSGASLPRSAAGGSASGGTGNSCSP